MSDPFSAAMKKAKQGGKIQPFFIVIGIIVVVVLIIVFTSFVVVNQNERAVILTFGSYTTTASPGLRMIVPFGIQKAYHVKTEVVQSEEFGFRTTKAGVSSQYSSQDFPEESTMLTGDLNIVSVEWIIQYRIVDPKAWLFNVSDKTKTIRDVSQAVVNGLVGDRTILGVIGPERQKIQVLAAEEMNKICDEFGMGINVSLVQLQNIVPPKGVQDAFEDVNKAIQDMNRLVNEGKEAYNSEIPKAQGQAKQMIEIASGYATERVNNAKGDVARFDSVYDQYRRAPLVTRERLYFEMMETILKSSQKVDLIDKRFTNFLPLKNLDAAKQAVTPASPAATTGETK